MEKNESRDCKTCKNADPLYVQDKDGNPHTTGFSPSGLVRCSGKKYHGRTYICKDTRKACGDYEYTPPESRT